MKNSGTVTRPWLTICSSAPCTPSWLRAKIPSVMKPIWATEENATTRRASGVVNAIAEP